MKKKRKNYWIYALMICLFGSLIYGALGMGEKFSHHALSHAGTQLSNSAFGMFKSIIIDNLGSPLTILLFQIIVILIAVRLFSHLFKLIGQPGVIGEIVAGIVLGPSLLGYFFPEFFGALFPADSLTNLNLLSQIGLVLFMFVIGMELDFGVLKNKMNETLVISHAGIVVPFFLGIVASFWVYEEYAANQTEFLPFALFIGISMSITAFPVLARIIQERNLTKSPIGVLSIASAANDDVTAWCLLAIVIAVAKAGTFLSALYTIALTLIFIAFMFYAIRPFLKKIGDLYANSEVINKSFVGFIFLILVTSAVATEIIGIHALFGAFIAGVIMPPNLGFRKVMMEKVEDLALVFFLPLFFAFTGLRTQIGLINSPELWGVCLLFIFIAILGKLGGCTIAARLVGESWKDSFIVGTLMNTRGLMELVALNIGYEMGILPPEIFVILILMALTTTFMTTPLLTLVEKIFAKAETYHTKGHKILLSFGRPESGKNLLAIANLFFGKKLKNTDIIAAHYTQGTDLNPAKASQYASESFKPVEEEASRLGLQVDKRYKVTDKITHEVIRLAIKEQTDLLLLGAGPQFMEEYALIPAKRQIHPLIIDRAIQHLKSKSFRLSGSLLNEKLDSILEQVDSTVAIFANRQYTDAKKLFLLLDNDSDLSLLTDIEPILENNDIPVGICFSNQSASLEINRQKLSEAIARHPSRFIPGEVITTNPELRRNDSLLIISYETCKNMAQNRAAFILLPSLLVIRHSTRK